MTAIQFTTKIRANGQYSFPALSAGESRLLELSGGFGNGTATIGYISSSGAFVAFLDGIGGSPITFTSEGCIGVDTPPSGEFAVSLTGATNATLNLIAIDAK